jgi:hypothetical protein
MAVSLRLLRFGENLNRPSRTLVGGALDLCRLLSGNRRAKESDVTCRWIYLKDLRTDRLTISESAAQRAVDLQPGVHVSVSQTPRWSDASRVEM